MRNELFSVPPSVVLLIAIPLYVFIGRWIALKSWDMWHVKGNNKFLSFLFFPRIYIEWPHDDVSLKDTFGLDTCWHKHNLIFLLVTKHPSLFPTLINSYMGKKNPYRWKNIYVIVTMIFWPAKITLNLGYIMITSMFYIVSKIFLVLLDICKGFLRWFFPH